MTKIKTVRYVVEERGWPWSKWRKVKEYEEHDHDFTYSGNPHKVNCKRSCGCGLRQILVGWYSQFGTSSEYEILGYRPDWVKVNEK